MHTYRELFAVSEFRALFVLSITNVGGHTVQQLALSSLVFAVTGSPFLAAVAFLAGIAPSAIGALALMSHADRVRPRRFLAVVGLVEAASALALARIDMPVLGMIAVVVSVGLVASLYSGVTGGLLRDVVGADGYVLARSVLNMTVGGMQIVGFALGGALIATLGPHDALLVASGLLMLSAVLARFGLSARPARTSGRGSVRLTTRGNKVLLGDRGRRSLFLAKWLPNGLIVGAESLYVPYAADRAGVLFCASAAGMLLGDVVMGRFVPAARRFGLVVPMRLLLAAPYLVFWFHPSWGIAAVTVFVASFGFCGSLALQERLLQLTPESLQAQGFGLSGSGTMCFQAFGALAIGATAEVAGVGGAMGIAAVASIAVTAALLPGLRVAGWASPPSTDWLSRTSSASPSME